MTSPPPAEMIAPEALHLPFDQYSRYRMIQEALDACAPLFSGPLAILDVGGFTALRRGGELLLARAFLPQHRVTVVDRPASSLPGYIQGDGRHLTFADGTFDFVISCDTLEHIPAPDRPAFWHELLRVVRHGVLLAAPFASLEVVAAERLLFDYIRAETGSEQPQLKEHRDYGLPDLAATRAWLTSNGLAHRVYPAGCVHAWLAMMLAKHYLLIHTRDLALEEQLDAYYTHFLSAGERRTPAYRSLLLVARTDAANHPPAWLGAADAALAPTVQQRQAPERVPLDAAPALAAWMLQVLPARLGTELSGTVASQAQTIAWQSERLAAQDARIADLEERARWLEAQADAARQALAAVEHGRLLRLLRWLQRQGDANR